MLSISHIVLILLICIAMDRKRYRRADWSDIQELLNIGGITRAGLSELLTTLRNAPAVPSGTTKHLDAAYHQRFIEVKVTVPIEMDKGDIFTWEFAEPSLLLQAMLDASKELTDLYHRTALMHTGDWDIILAWDEFAPGNKLQVDNRRKTMNLSFNFMQLGADVCSEDASWMTPVTLRHSIIAQSKIGWSGILAMFIKRFLFGPHGISTVGLPLRVNGALFIIKARLSIMISDGDGIRSAFNWKGAASTKPCLLHYNVFSRDSDLVHRAEGNVEITCHDPNLFKHWVDDGLEKVVDLISLAHQRYVRGEWTKKRFAELQQVCGMNFAYGGLLNDVALRSKIRFLDVIRYDWMHCALQSGTVTIEIWLFFNACKCKAGLPFAAVETFLKSGWSFVEHHRAKGKQLWRVFDMHRTQSSSKADKLKASASEQLAVYSLLRHFADVHVAHLPELAEEYVSFKAACDVVDLFLLAKRGRIPMREAGERLYQAMGHHLRTHKQCYGDSHITPKYHWLLDCCGQVAKDPFVIDCFVVERLHLRVKHVADPIKNTVNFERSVLAGLMNTQIEALRRKCFCDGLRGPSSQYPGVVGALVADKMDCKSQRITVGDLVFYENSVGFVLACVDVGGNLYCMVEVWDLIGNVSTYGQRWATSDVIQMWPSEHVQCASAWKMEGVAGLVALRL